MNNKALVVKNLSFSYGSKEILNNISLSVDEGEYCSLIGPNGAGKSTFLKTINRILPCCEGTIELFGKDIFLYTQKELGGLIGYVSQSRDYPIPFTVYEFVMMGRYPYLKPFSSPSKDDHKKVKESLCYVQCEQFSKRKVNQLSGGERQKVYLAAALAQEPKLLLLDEPITHLDPKYQVEIQKTICDVSKEFNITVIHVTHELSHLFLWKQRVCAIKNGILQSEGTSQDVLTLNNLNKIFDTEFLFGEHPLNKNKIILPKGRL